MEAKAKRWVAILASVCGALFVAVLTMGIVWAATLQNVQHSINISYTAQEISGSVTANVYKGSDTAISTNSHVFTGATTTTSGTLTTDDVVLVNSDGNKFVIYEWVIQNTSTSHGMTAALSGNLTATNVVVKSSGTTYTQIATPYTNYEDIATAATTGSQQTYFSTTVAADSTAYFYMIVSLDNLANDSSVTGNLTWALAQQQAS